MTVLASRLLYFRMRYHVANISVFCANFSKTLVVCSIGRPILVESGLLLGLSISEIFQVSWPLEF